MSCELIEPLILGTNSYILYLVGSGDLWFRYLDRYQQDICIYFWSYLWAFGARECIIRIIPLCPESWQWEGYQKGWGKTSLEDRYLLVRPVGRLP